ncbi:hypothetical protein A2U01_0082020, partial [Trifolium medium]|nr:hypothetical protein [Trifolium medium]
SSINNLKQGTKSVLDYFTELKSLWEELNSHRPLPSCTCVHQCRCPAFAIGAKLSPRGSSDSVLDWPQ